MLLGHYYHLWADGNWKKAWQEHTSALVDSGLLNELQWMRIGLIGSVENREEAKEHIAFGEIVVEADSGWEQVTLAHLRDWVNSDLDDWAVLYGHTKGSFNDDPLREAWRKSMTYDTVYQWRSCVDKLQDADAVGPFWMASLRPNQANRGLFFGGNFWWANRKYLCELPALQYDQRFRAEDWVGLNNPTVVNLREGPPVPGKFWKK